MNRGTSSPKIIPLAGSLVVPGLLALVLSCSSGDVKAGLGPNEPSPITQLVVSPSSAVIEASGVLAFEVAALHQDGTSTIPSVSWSASGGTITADGLYSAGGTAGTYEVVAVQQGGTLADNSTVTITAAQLQAVILTPSTASVATGGTQQFGVSGQWSDGSTAAPAVTYSATGGTITSGGLYTAGSTAGTFRVIARQQGGTLADSATVTVTAPVLQAVILTPTSASLSTGETQQFGVSGQWSNGATTAPSVTFSATGGSITSGGLYTAGGAAGTFRVIAVQQGGTLADTSVVDVSLVGTGPYPNRPPSFTNSAEIDFSQAIPGSPGSDRPISGAPGWAMIYDNADGGGSNFSEISDASAPLSPSGVWQAHWAPGSYGGGVIGSGSGHGIGNVYYTLPSPTALYGSIRIKFDANYAWHPISNKFVFLSPDAILVQLDEGGNWLHGEVLDAGVWLDPNNADTPSSVAISTWRNDPISRGVWHHVEFVVDRAAGTFKIWLDGSLKTSASNIVFPSSTFTEFNLTAFRGGGGETISQDMYWYYDHAFIAWR
jgi:hypothetical protein